MHHNYDNPSVKAHLDACEIDDDEQELPLLLVPVPLPDGRLQAPLEVGDLDDGRDQLDGGLALLLGDAAAEDVAQAALEVG